MIRSRWATVAASPLLVRWAVGLAALALTLWLGIAACIPPPVVPATAAATTFSAERAMLDVRQLGMRPHPVGTVDHDRIAAYLLDRLRTLGLAAERRTYLADDATIARIAQWSDGDIRPSELVDVIGILPGRDRRRPALLLMAHYDTVWGSPGAADDSVGVAAAIETVRAIRAWGTPARDVILLFTDGEETGLAGAKAFWSGEGLSAHVGMVVNLESRGGGGRVVMFETGNANGAAVAALAEAAPDAVANSLAAAAYARMPNRTDFTVAKAHGAAGFNFAFSDRAALYHSPLATPDRIDPRTVQDMGNQALALTAALAFADRLPAPSPDATFFDLLGRHLVHYPAAAGWLVVLAAAVVLAVGIAHQRPDWRALAGGAWLSAWMVAHGTLALTAFNQMSGAGAAANYYGRLAALPWLEAQAGFVIAATLIAALSVRGAPVRLIGALPGLVLGVIALKLRAPGALVWPAMAGAMAAGLLLPRRGIAGWGGWAGLVGVLVALAAAVQIALPPAAWVFAWPALVLAIAATAAALIGPRRLTLVLAGAAFVIVCAPAVPLGHLLMLGLGGPLPALLLLLAPMLLAAAWPLGRMRFGPRPAAAIVACLGLAGAIAAHVRSAPLAESVPAYSIVDQPARR